MVNVHALGGRKMMEAAREAVAQAAKPPEADRGDRAYQHGAGRFGRAWHCRTPG